MALFLPNLTLLLVVAATIEVTSVSARVCVLTTEPDESTGGKVRFVLPPGDPCSCTQVMLGGHNAYAPPRQDQRSVYIDTLPMDVEGLRRSQRCPNESTQSEELKKTSTSPDETSGTPVTSEAQVVYTDCQDALDQGKTTSGVYTINKKKPFKVYCDMETPNKGYIVIQRRNDGSVNFIRSWADYKEGFGDLNGEFWLGNDKIHKKTIDDPTWELLVTLTAFDDSVAKVRYDTFVIKEETNDYEIDVKFGGGEAGDAFDTKKFTTFDRDNDDDGLKNCAQSLSGGWWFTGCAETRSNLNGFYYNTSRPKVAKYPGLYWYTWKDKSLKATEMKIRQLNY